MAARASAVDRPASDAEPSRLAIAADAISKRFGEVVAVDALSLAVERGAVFGLLGPDGAGKSTLITMLATVQAPDTGDALVLGDSVVNAPDAVKPRIGYMSQRFSMYPDLTVTENLEFFARLRGVSPRLRERRAPRLLEQMGMEQFADRQADKLSGGMKQKLMLASTLMTEPELLLLDEPTTGVDPVSRREFWRIIAALHRQGKTVLVATPYMDEAERCTHVAFMAEGRLTRQGTPAQIKAAVPGRLFEVYASDRRGAVDVLCAAPGVRSASVLGEAVRVLAVDDGPDEHDLDDALSAAGIGVERVGEIAIDMEAAFAFLAERPGAEERERRAESAYARAVTRGDGVEGRSSDAGDAASEDAGEPR